MRRPILSVLVLSTVLAAGAFAAAEPLFEAARAGNLGEVRRLVEGGAEIDAADKYGTTALAMAVGAGHLEVVRYLLESGADPNRRESFYGSSPLSWSFFVPAADEATLLAIRKLLLEHGADDREQALEAAIRQGDVELARAAVASGPMTESALERLKAQAASADPAIREIVAGATKRPDPPPPSYSAAELRAFTGRYEGFASDLAVEVSVVEDRLAASLDGRPPVALEVAAERTFRHPDPELQAVFFGRAGTIEGVHISGADHEPQSLRRSVAEPAGPEAYSGVAGGRAAAAAPTVHWPAFRGAGATGVGDGVDAPSAWDLATGENVLWTADLPGLGNSSPVVWGDRVFVTTAVAAGMRQTIRTGLTGAGDPVDESVEHRWLVIALDKETGDRLWETEVARAMPLTKRHFKATQANSSPVTDGEHLVVVFPTAGLACLGLDGELHWKHELGGLNAGAFNDPGIEWGFAASPLLYDSMVIQQVDVHEGQYIAAWDLESGEQVWRTERDVAPSWATPNVLRGAEGDELIVNGSTIHGYDPASGRELWSLGPNSELVIATPVIGDGVAYVSAGYPPVKPIYAIPAGLRGDREVDPGAGDEGLVWSHGIGGAYMPTPLLYRGILYIVHHNGRLVAYDAATGRAIYKSRFSRGGTFTGSPVAVNGKLYAATEEGLVYVLEAGPEYREVAVNEIGEPLMATPAVSQGMLLLRTPSRLVAIAEPSAAEETAP